MALDERDRERLAEGRRLLGVLVSEHGRLRQAAFDEQPRLGIDRPAWIVMSGPAILGEVVHASRRDSRHAADVGSAPQMPLSADGVCLGEPGGELLVHLLG